jgi:hypothetical protein
MYPVNWPHSLRFVADYLGDIGDPIERLAVIDEIRGHFRDILTTAYEQACFDAKATDRTDEALTFIPSQKAFDDYARRWNGRLDHSERIRWSDPLTAHRLQQVLDFTKVTKGETPDAVGPIRRKRRPHLPKKR